MTNRRPDRTEVAEYYFTYINQVADGDIVEILSQQAPAVGAFFDGISEEQSGRRYADDKWSVRQTLGHLNDTERLFVSRAFWFARGFDTPLPSFEPDVAMTASLADGRGWRSHVDEFRAVRAATISFFGNLPNEAWDRRGIASDSPFSVRALAYICAGHLTHHVRLLRERYSIK